MMSGWAEIFLSSLVDFQPFPPPIISLCGKVSGGSDCLSSRNVSMRVSRFFRGSIVPMERMYGVGI